MTHSPPNSFHSSSPASISNGNTAEIPTEIISEEEMAFIDAALIAAGVAAPLPSAQLCRSPKSIRSITLLAKRGLSARASDIEDLGRAVGSDSPGKDKKIRVIESLLHRFRRGRGLSVTDITGTEWCEKQMEFTLLSGKHKKTKAMQAGIIRHAVLEEEVIKRIKVQIRSAEDAWALKLMNFIVGANQLLFDGLTRELPVIGFIEGVWMVGIIDEIRMPVSDSERFPLLVDTKTRVLATLPRESQKRNGRFQLMCYKYMWDSLIANKFPWHKFFDFFSLNPNHILSPDIRENMAASGLPSEVNNTDQVVVSTLFLTWDSSDVVRYFGNSCCLLPCAHDRLLLRYEAQHDQSLIGEEEFAYEPDCLKDQIQSCLEFWQGKREARYAPADERWKCRFCQFSSECPANSSPVGSTSTTENHVSCSPPQSPNK